MASLLAIQDANDQTRAAIGRAAGENESLDNEVGDLSRALGQMSKKMQEELQLAESLEQGNAALQTEILGSAQALNQRSSAAASTKEVGGIPVDSDYVIFVIDTSGSMQSVWGEMRQVVEDIIEIHPTVKGIQILDDMGTPMMSGFEGRWIPDTPKFRSILLRHLTFWRSYSNSNPTEGVQKAISVYCKPGKKVGIYVFADDFNGSADLVLHDLEIRTERQKLPAGSFRIHGVLFNTQTGWQTANFLRHLTDKYDGSLITVE
ncbi:MAG: hypothetical protein JRC77_06465 [Deltaproteobacteria bacterium]|nr:hypothetical protein [Deltaproteobacteria bacterium]